MLPLARPTISSVWSRTSRLPFGKRLFSRFLARMVPYSGSIGAAVEALGDGRSRVALRDRRAVRNHLGSIHAVALVNLGELATGLAVMHAVDGVGRGIVTTLKMDYFKKARGTITATCAIEMPSAPGTHDVEAIAHLHDAAGVEVARATATWRIDLPA